MSVYALKIKDVGEESRLWLVDAPNMADAEAKARISCGPNPLIDASEFTPSWFVANCGEWAELRGNKS